MRTCLVLEGGAMRGIYTAGVLDALMEVNVKVDAIIGVSAGALFGVNYVSNQKGRTLRYNLNYAGSKDYMGIYSLITTGNVMNKDFCFDKLVNVLDPFDFDTFNKSKIKFYATVTNLDTGKAEYVLIKKTPRDMEYLRASGSMPLFSRIVNIHGKKYLDGAISDSIPVKKALNMGYDKVIVVTTQPKEFRKKPYKMALFNLVYFGYPKFLNGIKNRHILYNSTLDFMNEYESNGNIFVIRPSKRIKISRLEKNKDIIKQQYDLGFSDMRSLSDKLIKYLKK